MKFSVVMSAYHEKQEYLETAIESILNQTFKDFEFIIILDDPQNSILKNVIEQYAAKDDRIIFLINNKNMGLALSLNRGIQQAQGEYIARMDADDISVTDRFERQLKFLENNPEIDILSSNKILINNEGDTVGRGGRLPTDYKAINRCLTISNFIVHPSVVMKRVSINKIGGYRNFPTTQDYDLWLRAISEGLCIGVLDEYLVRYRLNTESVTLGENSIRQPIIGNYIRNLYRERMRYGKDSFSEESLAIYLKDNGANDQKNVEKYNKSRETWEEARIALKNKNIIKGFSLSLKAFSGHKYVRKYILNNVRYMIIK